MMLWNDVTELTWNKVIMKGSDQVLRESVPEN